jgi:hypothetical protein
MCMECINAYSHVEHSASIWSQREAVSVDETFFFVEKTVRRLMVGEEMRNAWRLNFVSGEFTMDFLVTRTLSDPSI